MKGFDRISPSVAYPPMSRGLAYLVAYHLAEKGYVSEALMVLVLVSVTERNTSSF